MTVLALQRALVKESGVDRRARRGWMIMALVMAMQNMGPTTHPRTATNVVVPAINVHVAPTPLYYASSPQKDQPRLVQPRALGGQPIAARGDGPPQIALPRERTSLDSTQTDGVTGLGRGAPRLHDVHAHRGDEACVGGGFRC